MAGGQTSYQLNPDIAVPGMLFDQNFDDKVVSFPAGEYIEFGRLLEVDASGLVWKVSGTGAALVHAGRQLAGVSVYDVAREQQLAAVGGSSGTGGYQVGEMVPVCRKGNIFGCWDGVVTAFGQSIYGVPNVNHSSTTDPNDLKGAFTGATTSNTAGSEVAVVPAGITMGSRGDVSGLTPQRGAASSGSSGPTFVVALEVNLQGAP